MTLTTVLRDLQIQKADENDAPPLTKLTTVSLYDADLVVKTLPFAKAARPTSKPVTRRDPYPLSRSAAATTIIGRHLSCTSAVSIIGRTNFVNVNEDD